MTGRPRSIFDLALLGRHQAVAFAATALDFTTMVGLVELAHLPPPVATFASALLGGVTNFALSRGWAYRSLHEGRLHSQAARYVAVSVGGAILNALLLAVLTLGPVPYFPARVGGSVLVSLFYTYPLHTRFVFRVAR